MRKVTSAGATGPKNQVRRPTRPRRTVASPLQAPQIAHPGVEEKDYSSLIPEQFSGMNVTIKNGPTVKTATKGIPKNLFYTE